ncbi:MAG: hypothetical protein JST26_08615 [Bacteroidetes bacterium]|nr:hypothetical protein [Bacteroidota bacterium]
MAQYKPEVVDFYYSDCAADCEGQQQIHDMHIEPGDVCFLNFSFSHSCFPYFSPRIIKANNDTLSLDIGGEYSPWKHYGGAQEVVELWSKYRCDCYFNFSVRVNHTNKLPGVIIINGLFYHKYLGFVGYKYYEQNADRQEFSNNSAALSYNTLWKALSKPATDPVFLQIQSLLGNDYILWDNFYYINFPEDHVLFCFGYDENLESIVVDTCYKGELPRRIKWTDDLAALRHKLGKPDTKLDNRHAYLQNSYFDEKTRIFYSYHYKKHHLTILFAADNHIVGMKFENLHIAE